MYQAAHLITSSTHPVLLHDLGAHPLQVHALLWVFQVDRGVQQACVVRRKGAGGGRGGFAGNGRGVGS